MEGVTRIDNEFLRTDPEGATVHAQVRSNWTFRNVTALKTTLEHLGHWNEAPDTIVFECGGLARIDLAGAWSLYRFAQRMKDQSIRVRFENFREIHFKFLDQVTELNEERMQANNRYAPQQPPGRIHRLIESTGRNVVESISNIGFVTNALAYIVRRPGPLFWREGVRQVDEVGLDAVPLVALISFLIGIVLAYESSAQLQALGAEIFVVDLLAISILREMGVLLAAIMVAGRSASAFAASLGLMQLNEEVDALRVLGLNPIRILVAPRLFALLIALPLLTCLSDLAGLAGGWLMGVTVLDISTVQYLERAAEAVSFKEVMVGLVKAPVFAMIIAAVGTLRGMEVRRSAEELGRKTTTAVVQSIILIIIADAIFALVFAKMGI